jgi:hypothetical protein
MQAIQNEFDIVMNGEYTEDDLLFEKIKWTEDGITQLGTVSEIHSEKGIKYLTVMTIFGKRCKIKMSRVRLISEHVRA